ncbi:hypothetical protein AMTR_s00110p00119500 [Amborella trichopoda]|uniref:Uncharacterized protein n=1 Tax=Amborella trichopoda TaxID=13333 RepID=W1NZ41_AMBTC|nr:hypothetical protein AMTR_s00110p00119500 [Amborella trichopoda]
MEFSHRMVEYGFAITFVNTDYNHKRVLEAAKAHPQDRLRDGTEPVRLVSIPDGRKPGAAGTNLIHSQSILSSMPHALEKLINDITNVQGLELHCVVAGEHGVGTRHSQKARLCSSRSLAYGYYVPNSVPQDPRSSPKWDLT